MKKSVKEQHSASESEAEDVVIERDSDFDDDEEEDDFRGKVFNLKSKSNAPFDHNVSDDEVQGEDEDDDEEKIDTNDVEELPEDFEEIEDDVPATESKLSKKLKKLTSKELAKEQKRIKKTGVCYLSKVPPYMKPAKLRSVLSRFGEIDRLFLKPEDPSVYHKRVKYGGNKKKNFTEGWIEFVNKKDAKLCAATLNGNKLGGKKTSYYYDDIINIKYLLGFKWLDLTQQIAKENEVRQAKLALELSQQQKLNKAFVSNVEKSKMISNIQKKRKTTGEDEPIRRDFKQRKVATSRSDAKEELKVKSKPNEKLNDILSRVF
ncbi:MAG: RNA-binding protein [Asgard group archaeon]|nr:RNA-binding protein [Asgard group archaeon]